MFTAAVLSPVATTTVEAASMSITEYILVIDKVPYAIDPSTYIELKSAGSSFINRGKIVYIRATDSQVYLVEDYIAAKESISMGTMSGALELLSKSGENIEVEVGEVTFDDNGNPQYVAPENSTDAAFSVLSIK